MGREHDNRPKNCILGTVTKTVALSRRAHEMPASPIRKLAPYADAAKARGVHVYFLNIGQPDLKPPQQFWDAVRNFSDEVLAYSHSAGTAELRAKAALKYTEMGLNVTADQVLVTTAGSEALSIALGVICDSGDEVIVPEPMYANYIGFAAGMGLQVVAIPTRLEDNFALPPVEEFEKKITPRTKAIILCNPGNPTGIVYSDEQLHALRNIAVRHGLFVISDEVYREFVYEGGRPTSVLELDGMDELGVMVDSVSKRFSLCGARIGFLVSRNAELMSSALRFAQARLSSPTLEMAGVVGALDAGRDYFDAVRDEYRRRRDLLVTRLRSIPGVVCPEVQGAFYATVRLPVDDADQFAQWLLESFEQNGSTVMIAPASGFYSTKGMGKDEARIAYVLKESDLDKAMDCLELALQQYPGRR